MPAKAVVEIPVNDEAFRKFLDLYTSYSEKLGEQSDQWEALNSAIGTGKEQLALAAAQAELIADHIQDANKAQIAFSRATAGHSRDFVQLGRAGTSAWKAIGGAAEASISKVGSGLAGLAEGALAAFGPLGLAAGAIAAAVGAGGAALKGLADAAVTRQRSAFSKGITPGQEASFGIYAQQFLGSGALQAAANTQLDYGSAGPLSLLGIDFDKARGMTASDLALKMLRGAVVGAQAHPELPLLNNPAVQAYLSRGGDIGDVRNAMKMGLSSLDDASAEEARNAGRLNLTRGAVSDSAVFKKAVEGAGGAAQSFAINHLSGADRGFATVIGALTGDKTAQATVSSAFQNVTKTIDKEAVPAIQKFDHALDAASGGVLSRVKAAINASNDWVNHATGGALTSKAVRDAAASAMHSINSPIAGSASAAILAVAKQKGIDPLLALASAMQESGLDPRAQGDYDKHGRPTSFGLFQLHEGGELGSMTPSQAFNPTTNALVALSEFAKVAKAHPEWSPGQIAAGAQRPADPVGYAKSVDAIYAALLKAQRAQRTSTPNVKVEVTNSTSSNVAASINATAQI